MYRQNWMIVVAGEPLIDALTQEQDTKIPRSGAGFVSEALCALQREHAARQIVGVEIVASIYGHSVRYDSGLQDFGLLAGSRSGQLDGTLADAERFAREWVERDPTRRYAWRRRRAGEEPK
jgi:hypothetical protein